MKFEQTPQGATNNWENSIPPLPMHKDVSEEIISSGIAKQMIDHQKKEGRPMENEEVFELRIEPDVHFQTNKSRNISIEGWGVGVLDQNNNITFHKYGTFGFPTLTEEQQKVVKELVSDLLSSKEEQG